MTDVKKPLSHDVSSKLRFPIFTHVVMAFPEVFLLSFTTQPATPTPCDLTGI